MTEDMRERFEKAREDFAAAYNDMHSRCVARAAFMAGWQEAALSSAGTSGTDALVENILDVAYDSLLTHSQRKTNITALLRGDSLSGKGEATSVEVCAEQPGHFKTVASKGYASSPDRAEELAQDKFAELRSFLTNMRRDAADAEDPELSEYAQAIEQRLDELASLLRDAMGRCPTCGLTIVPRLCANPACASSVRR